MATGEVTKQNDVVSVELPAPAGWVKKLTPKKGGTRQINDIVFISPNGDEIKNKQQLDQYLKSHPGGPAITEFDWATADTPRRSARLSEKSKLPEGPKSWSPKKRRKRSSPKGSNEKSNAEAEGDIQENKVDADVDTNEAGDGEVIAEEAVPEKPNTEAGDGEVIAEEAVPEKPNTEKVETETQIKTKVVLDEPSGADTQNDNANANANVQKSDDVVQEVPSATEAHNASNTDNLNADVDISYGAINEESKEALPVKEVPDGKVNCAEPPVVEDKNGSEKEFESEKPVLNDVKLHEQEPTTGS